jgi:hypothetical protein
MKAINISFLIICSLLIGIVTSANSTNITSAVSVSTTMGEADNFSEIENIINQSGLTSSYISGSTDFDAFITTNHKFEYIDREWFSTFNTMTGTITFDLGKLYNVDRLAIWNEDSFGINAFTVSSAGEDNVFGAAQSFTAISGGIFQNYSAQVFTLTSTTLAQYLKISVQSTHSNDITQEFGFASLGEVAFSTSPVPEPTTLLLLGTGLLGLIGVRKKK